MRLIRWLKKDLFKEVSDWVKQEIITEQQAAKICDRYGIDYAAAASQTERSALGALSGVAFAFFGIAVIMLIGYNWEDIPRTLRTSLVLGTMLAVNGYGLHLYLAGRTAFVTQLFFLGNLLYGAAIVLVAQIYHIGEHMPDGVFWWALGTMPLGLILNSTALAFLTLFLGSIWMILEYATMQAYTLEFLLFLAAALFVLVRGRTGQTSYTLFVATHFAFFFWLWAQLAVLWRGESYVQPVRAGHLWVSIAMMIFLYAGSLVLRTSSVVKFRDYAAATSLWSVRVAFWLLLIFNFEFVWRALLQEDYSSYQISMWVMIGSLLASSVALVIWLSREHVLRIIALSAMGLLPMILLVLVVGRNHIDSEAVLLPLTVASSVVSIFAGVGLIIYSAQKGISHYGFLGMTLIALTAAIRYFQLFAQDYLTTALFFAGMGVAILLMYWLLQIMRKALLPDPGEAQKA